MKQRLSTIGQSEGVFCEQTGIQLAHSRVPHLPIPAGWRNASKHCDSVHPSDVCYKFHGKSSSVGGSPSRAEWEHRNYCAMFWGHISEGALQVSTFLGDVNYPISSTGLIPCGSCTEPHGKSIRRKKRQPLSLPDVHKTQDVCELGATVLPFIRSLFGAAGRGPTPCR